LLKYLKLSYRVVETLIITGAISYNPNGMFYYLVFSINLSIDPSIKYHRGNILVEDNHNSGHDNIKESNNLSKNMKLFKIGKVKEVYELENGNELEFKFTDNISVFDKVIPTKIPHKGETLCKTSTFWFKGARELGILSHFISNPGPKRMRVKKVNIIHDYSKINNSTKNYLIPLEFICRYYVAGSLYNRVQAGKIDTNKLGFPNNAKLEYGSELPEPYIEVTTKLEPVDRSLSLEEAMKISGLTREEYQTICETILSLDMKINSEIKSRGLIHVDGKKEFAFNAERNLMLIDTFGTADEDRFWDRTKYDDGEFVELSKEYVRQHYKRSNYYDALTKAREAGKAEPNIPPLDVKITGEVSKLYIELFEKITGQKFYR
jgi:phosphoribosylaminoimidazole-succinocarboxamide synthase